MLWHSTGELTPELHANSYLRSEDLQHSTFQKLSFDRLLCRTPPPFGGSVSLTLPYTVHSSPYQNPIIIVQLSVAETPPPFGGSVSLTLPYTVQQTIAIANINMPMY